MTIEEIHIDSTMQTTSKLFISFLLFLALSLSAIAQERDLSSPFALNEEAQAMFRVLGTPLIQAVLEEGDRNGMVFVMLTEPPVPIYPNFKEEFGIIPNPVGKSSQFALYR